MFKKFNLSLLMLFSAIALVCIMPGCARKVSFQQSNVVPGAEGRVKIKQDDNKNFSIDVDVLHLADPKRLSPPKSGYLVWMETDQNTTRLLGQINTSSGFLSKTRKASLNTVTPFKPLRIFITAEDNLNSVYPEGQTVLTTGNL